MFIAPSHRHSHRATCLTKTNHTHIDRQPHFGYLYKIEIGMVSVKKFHFIGTRTIVAWTNVNGTNVPKTVDNSYRWPNN